MTFDVSVSAFNDHLWIPLRAKVVSEGFWMNGAAFCGQVQGMQTPTLEDAHLCRGGAPKVPWPICFLIPNR